MNARALGHTALLIALLSAAACRSSKEEEENEAAAPLLAAVDLEAGPPVIVGTVVEASSGEPVAGARVVAPDGTAAVTDAEGRFLLKGLALGTAGDLVATAGGRRGAVRLRPVSEGRLEVVLHVR